MRYWALWFLIFGWLAILTYGVRFGDDTNKSQDAAIIALEYEHIRPLKQALKIEQDNWARLYEDGQEILRNDEDYRFEIDQFEKKINALNARVYQLEPRGEGNAQNGKE